MDDESQNWIKINSGRQFPGRPGRPKSHLLGDFESEEPKSLIEKLSCCFHFYTRIAFFCGGVLLFIVWICITFE